MLAGLVGGIGLWAMDADAQGGPPAPRQPGFWLTGLAPNATYGWVTCLSGDGATAGGFGAATTPKIFAAGFTWTKVGGRSDFGLLPGMPAYTPAYGLSNNGVVVGVMATQALTRAYRWTGSGPLQDLGVLPTASRSFAKGISGDGMIVVGYGETGPNSYEYGEAFRWTAASGMKSLGKLTPQSFLSDARAISRDGSTIVGFNKNEVLWYQAFVWTEAGGMKALPTLTGSASGAEANGVNADGSLIVGSSSSAAGKTHAVRWVAGQPQDLASKFNTYNSIALSMSDDGAVVGGSYSFGPPSKAFIWTEATGMLDAKDYLSLHGIEVPAGYKLEYVYAISGDGRTFGGAARNLSTNTKEGFVATVPGKGCFADCDASGGLDIDDFICFQTRFAIEDPYADCDASGGLDIDDFICFQTLFAVGCQG